MTDVGTPNQELASEAPASGWAVGAIEALKLKGFVKDDLFLYYQSNITRKDFAYLSVVLYEEINGEAVAESTGSSFIDCDDPYVLKAKDLGIIQGYGNGKFGTYDPVTREQICVMLVKALNKADVTLDATGLESIDFKDKAQIAGWSMDAVKLSYNNEIMKGVGERTIAPKNNTTREQSLVLFSRILDKYVE